MPTIAIPCPTQQTLSRACVLPGYDELRGAYRMADGTCIIPLCGWLPCTSTCVSSLLMHASIASPTPRPKVFGAEVSTTRKVQGPCVETAREPRSPLGARRLYLPRAPSCSTVTGFRVQSLHVLPPPPRSRDSPGTSEPDGDHRGGGVLMSFWVGFARDSE